MQIHFTLNKGAIMLLIGLVLTAISLSRIALAQQPAKSLTAKTWRYKIEATPFDTTYECDPGWEPVSVTINSAGDSKTFDVLLRKPM